ncbi:hypothetical protein [Paraburkholderia humisilvae]|uniref:hypothetical protein n=1 Tax=Paraburkholderia humisilvae TaxID=627669 RepID=UPI0015842613|nr:hypothetical protein [Paraburkholderia humisilvae]
MLDQTLPLTPLLSPMLAALVAVVGWYVVHRSNTARDHASKRHDLIVQYLLEAYRRLENAANREDKTEEQAVAFESAVADIQFLGSPDQITETVKYLKAHASVGGGTIDNVLSLLRNDLRKELGLSRVNHPLMIFRFVRDRSSEWRPGSFQENPVCRTIDLSINHDVTTRLPESSTRR